MVMDIGNPSSRQVNGIGGRTPFIFNIFYHRKCTHISTAMTETVRLFYHRKCAHVSTAMMETVRLFYHFKWAHVSATRTSNRTSSLQVSMFPPTVGPRPEVVHGAIHLSPYISHHFY